MSYPESISIYFFGKYQLLFLLQISKASILLRGETYSVINSFRGKKYYLLSFLTTQDINVANHFFLMLFVKLMLLSHKAFLYQNMKLKQKKDHGGLTIWKL